MNIKTLTLTALLASAATMSFAEVNSNESQQPASEAAEPVVVVSDQEPVEAPTPTPEHAAEAKAQ